MYNSMSVIHMYIYIHMCVYFFIYVHTYSRRCLEPLSVASRFSYGQNSNSNESHEDSMGSFLKMFLGHLLAVWTMAYMRPQGLEV